MDSRKRLLAKTGGNSATIQNSEPKPRFRPVETVLRHLTVIDPIALHNVPQPAGSLRYEVFDQETQQTHRFQTEADMYQWLGY